MHFTSLTKIGLLSLVAQSHAAPWLTGTDDSFGFVQSLSTAFTRLLGVGPKTPVTVGTFVPSSDNLIIVPPTFEGQGGSLGWTFPVSEGSQVGRNVVDGFSKDISVMLTSPGEDEEFLMGMSIGPQHGLCGFTPGETARGFIRPSVVGNYSARWIVKFGQSTQPDVPVDPRTGCGPEPFNFTTVEFAHSWGVLPASA